MIKQAHEKNRQSSTLANGSNKNLMRTLNVKDATAPGGAGSESEMKHSARLPEGLNSAVDATSKDPIRSSSSIENKPDDQKQPSERISVMKINNSE